MPTIRILQPGDEPVLEAFLLPRMDSSMFLISNMRSSGLSDQGQPYQGTYAAAFENEGITGVVAHYWNHNLVLQAPVHLDALWREAIAASKRPIKGLIGPNDQVGAVRAALDIDGSRLQMNEIEKLYSLQLDDLNVPHLLSASTATGRRIEPRDVELVTAWRVAYSLESLGAKDGPQLRKTCRSSIERSLREGRTWVLESQGRLVACTSFNSAIQEAVQVGGVWTPPELRRRGYGRAVVAVSLLAARSEGVGKAILFTPESNIAAQKAYSALGFRHIGDYCITLFPSPVEDVV